MIYPIQKKIILFAFIVLSIPSIAQLAPDNEAFSNWVQSKNHTSFNTIARGTLHENSFDITFSVFDFHLNPSIREIKGNVTHTLRPIESTNQLFFWLAPELSPDSILFDGENISFQHQDYNLSMDFAEPLNAEEFYTVQIFYAGTPPDNGYFLQDEHNGIPVLATFAEPYGASDWWPCQAGLSDKIDSLNIILTIPENYTAGANGTLVEDLDNTDGTHTLTWHHRFPVVNYNIAFAVSEYVAYENSVVIDETTMPIKNLVYAEDLLIAQNTTENLPEAIVLFSNLFGNYPFLEEKYGHMQWNRGGAMEHQTMTSTCCWDYELLVHELAHQWFGNMVTTASWHDIFLNEGFATYLSGLAYENLFPEKDYWNIWKSQKQAHITSLPDGSVFVSDTTDIDRIFDARLTYNKGAMIIHMLRGVVGDEAFFEGVNNYLYAPQNQYGFGTMDNFIETMGAAADTNLTEFFNDWYYGEGYPSYNIAYVPGCSALFEVTLTQTTSDPSVDFFEMPVTLWLKSYDRDTLIVLNNTENNQYFLIPLDFCVEEVVFDPDIWLVSGEPTFTNGVEDGAGNQRIRIFPNPTNGNINVQLYAAKSALVTIYSYDGKLVYSHNFENIDGTISIDAAFLRDGVYFLETLMGENRKVQKFIKQ